MAASRFSSNWELMGRGSLSWLISSGAPPLALAHYYAFLLEGAQSDSEISLSYHPSDVSLDRGYTSDSEVYTDHNKQSKMHRSVTDVDVVNSGWLVVSDTRVPGATECTGVRQLLPAQVGTHPPESG